jgi:hypothetical protein
VLRHSLLVALLATLSVCGAAAEVDARSYALVVGVSDYPGTLLDLPLVNEDVKAITLALTDTLGFRPEDILVLQDEAATREAVLDGITGFLGAAGERDLALFYYSGHGTRVDKNVALGPDLDPEADGQDEALVTHDELLVDDEIAHALQSVRARRLLVLFDSCHSGDATRADLSRGQPKSVEYEQASKYIELPTEFRLPDVAAAGIGAVGDSELGLAGGSRLFIAASNEEELSWVAPDLGLSLFTYFFTDRLAGARDKSFEELVGEVSPRVSQYAQQYFQVPQSPHIEGSAEAAAARIGAFFRVAAEP